MPTFDVHPLHYVKAVGVGTVVAVLGGVFWWVAGLALFIVIPGTLSSLLSSLLALPLGYIGGDLISRSINRKRSNGLAWVAGGAVVLAAFTHLQLPGLLDLPAALFSPFYGLIATAAGVYLAIQRLKG